MAWPTNPRPAKCLPVLLLQLNLLYPKRSKASDGMLGDSAHQGTTSDHNPNGAGVVTALDVTHDPGDGLDIQELADQLIASKDARIKYIICNRRIWQSGKWVPYSGPNPHTKHLHLSVKGNYDSTTKWDIGEDMSNVLTNRSEAILLERIIQMDHTPSAASIKAATGVDLEGYLRDRSDDGDFLKNKKIVRVDYPAAVKEIDRLNKLIASMAKPVVLKKGIIYTVPD